MQSQSSAINIGTLQTQLMGFIRNEQLALIEALFQGLTPEQKKELVNFRENSEAGMTPLMLALNRNFSVIAKYLLSIPKINVNLENARGFTPLQMAMQKFPEVAVLLLQNQFDPPIDINALHSRYMHSAVSSGLSFGSVEPTNKLLDDKRLESKTINQVYIAADGTTKHTNLELALTEELTPPSTILKLLKRDADPLAATVIAFLDDEKRPKERRDLIRPFVEYRKKLQTNPMDAKTSLELRAQEVTISKLYREHKEDEEAKKWEQKALQNESKNIDTLAEIYFKKESKAEERTQIATQLETYVSQLEQIKDEKNPASLSCYHARAALTVFYWSSENAKSRIHLKQARALLKDMKEKPAGAESFIKAVDYLNLSRTGSGEPETKDLNPLGDVVLFSDLEFQRSIESGCKLSVSFLAIDLEEESHFVAVSAGWVLSAAAEKLGVRASDIIPPAILERAKVVLANPNNEPYLSALSEAQGWKKQANPLAAAQKFLKIANDKKTDERIAAFVANLMAAGALLESFLKMPGDEGKKEIMEQALSAYVAASHLSKEKNRTFVHLPMQLAMVGKIIPENTLSAYITTLISCYGHKPDNREEILPCILVDNVILLIKKQPTISILQQVTDCLYQSFQKDIEKRSNIITLLTDLHIKIADPSSPSGKLVIKTLAQCHRFVGDYQQAIELYKTIPEEKSEHAAVLISKAEKMKDSDRKQAMEDFKEAAALTASPEALLGMAEIYHAESQPGTAIKHYEGALHLALESKSVASVDKILQSATRVLTIHVQSANQLQSHAFANPDYAHAKLNEHIETHKKITTFSGLLALVNPPTPPFDAKNTNHKTSVLEGINHWVGTFTESTPDKKEEKDNKDEKATLVDEVFQKSNTQDLREIVDLAYDSNSPVTHLAQYAYNYVVKRQAAKKTHLGHYPSANRLLSIDKIKLEGLEKQKINPSSEFIQTILENAALCIEKGDHASLKKYLTELDQKQFTPNNQRFINQLFDRLDFHAANQASVVHQLEALARKGCLQALDSLATRNQGNKKLFGGSKDVRKVLSLYLIILLELKKPTVVKMLSQEVADKLRKNATDYLESTEAKKYENYVAEIKRVIELPCPGNPFHFAAVNLFASYQQKKKCEECFKTPIMKILRTTEGLFTAESEKLYSSTLSNNEESNTTVIEEEPKGTPPSHVSPQSTTVYIPAEAPVLIVSQSTSNRPPATVPLPLYPKAPHFVVSTQSTEVKELIASIQASASSQPVLVPNQRSVALPVIATSPPQSSTPALVPNATRAVVVEPSATPAPTAAFINPPSVAEREKAKTSQEKIYALLLPHLVQFILGLPRKETRDTKHIETSATSLPTNTPLTRDTQQMILAAKNFNDKKEVAQVNRAANLPKTVVSVPSSLTSRRREIHDKIPISRPQLTTSPVSNPHQLFSSAFLASAPVVSAPTRIRKQGSVPSLVRPLNLDQAVTVVTTDANKKSRTNTRS